MLLGILWLSARMGADSSSTRCVGRKCWRALDQWVAVSCFSLCAPLVPLSPAARTAVCWRQVCCCCWSCTASVAVFAVPDSPAWGLPACLSHSIESSEQITAQNSKNRLQHRISDYSTEFSKQITAQNSQITAQNSQNRLQHRTLRTDYSTELSEQITAQNSDYSTQLSKQINSIQLSERITAYSY